MNSRVELGREFANFCLQKAREIPQLPSFIESAKRESERIGYPFSPLTLESITRWHDQINEPIKAEKKEAIARRSMRARVKRQRRIDRYRAQ